MATVEQIGTGSPDGATFQASTTEKLSFYGVTPVVQPSGATQATITTTWVTISSGFGFATSADVISIIAAVQAIQTVLKTLGLWKGTS